MILLNWNFLSIKGRGKSLEEISLGDFDIGLLNIHKASFIGFIWNDKVKILKNRRGKVGIFGLEEFKRNFISVFDEIYQ